MRTVLHRRSPLQASRRRTQSLLKHQSLPRCALYHICGCLRRNYLLQRSWLSADVYGTASAHKDLLVQMCTCVR